MFKNLSASIYCGVYAEDDPLYEKIKNEFRLKNIEINKKTFAEMSNPEESDQYVFIIELEKYEVSKVTEQVQSSINFIKNSSNEARFSFVFAGVSPKSHCTPDYYEKCIEASLKREKPNLGFFVAKLDEESSTDNKFVINSTKEENALVFVEKTVIRDNYFSNSYAQKSSQHSTPSSPKTISPSSSLTNISDGLGILNFVSNYKKRVKEENRDKIFSGLFIGIKRLWSYLSGGMMAKIEQVSTSDQLSQNNSSINSQKIIPVNTYQDIEKYAQAKQDSRTAKVVRKLTRENKKQLIKEDEKIQAYNDFKSAYQEDRKNAGLLSGWGLFSGSEKYKDLDEAMKYADKHENSRTAKVLHRCLANKGL